MIMAGGAGTRLWPMSRRDRPKQLIPFIDRGGGAKSLLTLAADRLDGLVEPEQRYICTGERYRDEIKRTVKGFTDARILGEPAARDTVNAVGFAAAVFEKQDPNAVFAVLTSDHIIEPDNVFRERMDLGFRLVEDDPTRICTFSITPTYPATGFGYVQRGGTIDGFDQKLAFRVGQFVEKPDLPRAQAYVESGDYGWNAGMFVVHAGTFLDCLRRFKPESHDGLRQIQGAWGTTDQQRVLETVYPTLPKISVDYAVMEPASKDESLTVCGVAMDVDWIDVGSWPSYAETLGPDADGNSASGPAKVYAHDARDNLVVTDPDDQNAANVALLGVSGLAVVQSGGATLVMPKAMAQQLKELHEKLPDDLK